MNFNYYAILEISQTATPKEVKAAYRKMALRYHPDRNKGNAEAEKKFRQVRVAYETLSNAEKRKQYDATLLGKANTKFSGNILLTKKAFQAIKIFVAKRVIDTDEIFEVIVRSNIPCTHFKLQGLHNFIIMEAPEFYKKQQPISENEPLVQVKYKLKAKSTGYLAIGPASVVVRNICYESDVVFVKAKEPGTLVAANKRYENMIIRFGLGVVFIIFGLVVYNINKYGIKSFSVENIPAEKITYRSLKTGYTPYSVFFAETEKLAVESKNMLRIKNRPDTDLVAFLVEKETNTIARNHYIKAGDMYEIKFIPDGYYYLKIMFGNDWNSNKPLFEKNIKGGFERDVSFLVFGEKEQLMKMQQSVINDSVHYSIYEVSLTPTDSGNAKSILTDEKSFFSVQVNF